jgi:hypothetical protein
VSASALSISAGPVAVSRHADSDDLYEQLSSSGLYGQPSGHVPSSMLSVSLDSTASGGCSSLGVWTNHESSPLTPLVDPDHSMGLKTPPSPIESCDLVLPPSPSSERMSLSFPSVNVGA